MDNKIKKVFVYNPHTNPLPSLKTSAKLLQQIISLPILNKVSFLKMAFCKSINIPITTFIGKGFKCSSGNLILKENVCLNDTFILDYAPVYIGKNVSFSFRNIVLTSTHDFGNFNNIICKPIFIEDNVWITTGVTILGGVTIGANSVIAAGSVVTCDIPAGVLAGGNPCKVIKKIDFNK